MIYETCQEIFGFYKACINETTKKIYSKYECYYEWRRFYDIFVNMQNWSTFSVKKMGM